MAQPKTTWEDLARLGWPINSVFILANAQRGGSMRNIQDLALNERFALEWQYVDRKFAPGLYIHRLPAGIHSTRPSVGRTCSAVSRTTFTVKKPRGHTIIARAPRHWSTLGRSPGPTLTLLPHLSRIAVSD